MPADMMEMLEYAFNEAISRYPDPDIRVRICRVLLHDIANGKKVFLVCDQVRAATGAEDGAVSKKIKDLCENYIEEQTE